MIKDVGKFLGVYFFIIACIQIIFMFLNQYATSNIMIPANSLINIIIGYFIFNHNEKTRKVVIVLAAFMMVLQFSIFIYFSINEIPDTAHIHLLGIEITNLVSTKNIPILFAISIIIPAIPFILLRTNQSINEFSNNNL